MLFYDFEVFKFDWLVVIMNTDDKSTTVIVNDKKQLIDFYDNHKNEIWCGYNSRHYDQYILKSIINGLSAHKCNTWIMNGNNGWEFSSLNNKIRLLNYDVMTDKFKGLKQLEGFMGNNIKESSVSFDIKRKLTDEELDEVIKYCKHDVEQTMQVFVNQVNEFNAHMSLIKMFKLDITNISKTKPQLSAKILKAIKQNRSDEFDYEIVNTIKLSKYSYIKNWYLDTKNRDYSKTLKTKVANVEHLFGWGGLHGARKNYIEEGIFVNSDVGSFYPSLMIEYDFLSRNVLDKTKFKEIYDTRMKLKREGKKKEQAPLKIVLNSTYGAMKDQFNDLYDPRQANNVCINGQLMLLDLIEKLEDKFTLIQSNTDGVMFKLNSMDEFEEYKQICCEWSRRTKMNLEHDLIKKVVQKDVNNYLIVMNNGKIKSKGAYAKEIHKLDYDLPIVNKALKEYFINGASVEDTINNCDDLIMFQKIIKVSNKYKCVIYGDKVLKEKTLRVFAAKEGYGLYKIHKNKTTKDKIANTPEHCFIVNEDINNMKIDNRLDKNYYIEVCKQRIRDFEGV